jgi:hypothetical protein
MADSKIHDTIIIGGRPAGLTAGLYAARTRLNAVLIERMCSCGQLLPYKKKSPVGFPEGIGAFGPCRTDKRTGPSRERLRAAPTQEKAFQPESKGFIYSL